MVQALAFEFYYALDKCINFTSEKNIFIMNYFNDVYRKNAYIKQ